MICTRTYLSIVAITAIIIVVPAGLHGQKHRRAKVYQAARGSDYRSPVQEFEQYSFGVGNLAKQSSAAGGGPLGSSIYSGQSMTRRSSGAAPSALAGGVTTPSKSRRVATGSTMSIPTVAAPSGGGGMLLPPPTQQELALARMEVLAEDLAAGRKEVIDAPDRPITTLAPDMPGKYSQQMKSGEIEFRRGKYVEAREYFAEAARLSSDSPGALLSLARTNFATGRYDRAAAQLARVLRVVPELPTLNVQPRSFYGSDEAYQANVQALNKHVAANPTDAGALLLLAQVEWRHGNAARAAEHLAAAHRHAGNGELKKAIDVFRDGIGAGGDQAKLSEPTGSPLDLGEPNVPLAEPVDYQSAGIRFALPEGLVNQPLAESSQLVRARIDEGTDQARGLTASAFPVAKGVTARMFLNMMTEAIRRKLIVRGLKVTSDAAVSVSGNQGAIRMFTYDFRGNDYAAMAVCFVREIESQGTKGESVRLAYLLVGEVPASRIDQLSPAMVSVLETIEFTELRHPAELPVSQDGFTIKDHRLGYTMRQPAGWAAHQYETGLVMGRVDYLFGGLASPRVKLLVFSAGEQWTARALCEYAIEKRRKEGYHVELLEQGQTDLGGHAAYQFVVRKSFAPGSGSATQPAVATHRPQIEVGRVVSLAGAAGKRRLYGLVVTCHNVDASTARGIMDQLALGFTLPHIPAKQEAPQ